MSETDVRLLSFSAWSFRIHHHSFPHNYFFADNSLLYNFSVNNVTFDIHYLYLIAHKNEFYA